MKPENGFLLGILLIILIITGLGLSTAYSSIWQQGKILYYTTAGIIFLILYIYIKQYEKKQHNKKK